MAKFCGNCGAPVADDANVCGSCGVPVKKDATKETIPGVEYTTSPDQEKKQKMIKRGIIIGSVVIGLIIIWNLISMFTGYKTVVKDTVTAINNGDTNKLLSISSSTYNSADSDSAFEAEIENPCERVYNSIENEIGENFTLSHKITNNMELKGYMLEEALDDIDDDLSYYGVYFNRSKIKEAQIVEVEITARRGSQTTEREMQMLVVKEGIFSWKLLAVHFNY